MSLCVTLAIQSNYLKYHGTAKKGFLMPLRLLLPNCSEGATGTFLGTAHEEGHGTNLRM